jgi:hypothetical protein
VPDRARPSARASAASAVAPQPFRAPVHAADRQRDARVRDVAVELRRHVDLDQIALREHALAGDPVHRLVVDGQAEAAREAVGLARGGARAVACEDLFAHGVQLGRGHARHELAPRLGERLGDDAPRAPQRGQLGCGPDRHACAEA